MPSQVNICGRPMEEFLLAVENFHGWKAPGVVIGGFMVDWAQEGLGSGIEADAIVETCHCLPDAVQLLTPCTFGNGWLKVLDWDKFALSLYDKKTLEGFRVWLDLQKAQAFADIYNWYMRLVPKKSLPLEVLLESILSAGRAILSCAPVRITGLHGKKGKGEVATCGGCGEAFPASQGNRCLACQGRGYYQKNGRLAVISCQPSLYKVENRLIW